MKRIRIIRTQIPLAVAVVLMLVVGCHHNPATVATPPPPGAINQFDATAYRICADAQAAIESVKADVAAGTITLSDSQKSILNQLITHYNTAESLAQAYHATGTSAGGVAGAAGGSGGADGTAALTAALNQVIADIAAVATQIQATTKQKVATATTGGVS